MADDLDDLPAGVEVSDSEEEKPLPDAVNVSGSDEEEGKVREEPYKGSSQANDGGDQITSASQNPNIGTDPSGNNQSLVVAPNYNETKGKEVATVEQKAKKMEQQMALIKETADTRKDI